MKGILTMTTARKHDSKGPVYGTQKTKESSQISLKLLRYDELDAEFVRQSRRLARIVSRMKHDITRKLG
jgi:hypothetical protein